MNKKFCIFGVVISLFAQLYANSTDMFLKPELVSELNEKGSIRRIFQNEDVSLTLTPNTVCSQKVANSWNLSEKPNLVSENLFLVKKSELKEKSSFPEEVDFSIDNVSKIVRSISKMKGMRYYSETRKKWQTLYHEAYVCKSLEEKNISLADVTEGSADGLNIFCFLEDNSFGKSVYSANYLQKENEVGFTLTNSESWTYSFVRALEPNSVKISMVVIDNDDSYLVYMLLQAKHKTIPLLGDKIQKSLANRIDAIFNWFTYQF
ncbi:DUF6675 family protein [Treponema pectinovorum]|uniref:DUF6675 family protein n=1 Tax=Treponema pectinovorum TaxID=164 RepID=UPI0011C9D1D4|nr:DUF6675 family protein [Treponema pectinovorum]